PYDNDKYDSDQVDIYYYNELSKTWIKQNGTVDHENGTITVQVNHFSTYAVLAVTKENAEEDEQAEVLELTDGDYSIEYEALHAEEDKASGMAKYLDNPAFLSVTDGKVFLTLTIN